MTSVGVNEVTRPESTVRALGRGTERLCRLELDLARDRLACYILVGRQPAWLDRTKLATEARL